MAVQAYEFIAETVYGLGEFDPVMDPLTGSIDGVDLQGNTAVLAGLTSGLVLATVSECFTISSSGATFEQTYIPEVVYGDSDTFAPTMDDLTGTIDGVDLQGNTAALYGVDFHLSLATISSCFFAPVVPTPTTVFNPVGSGKKVLVMCPNIWDWCQRKDQWMWEHLKTKPKRCNPTPCWKLETEPYHEIPLEGIEFNKTGIIDLPTPGSGDTVVVSFTVPLGYDGIIYGVLNQFTGSGFMDGNGDVLWRLQIARRWVKNMGNMAYQAGDFNGFMQLDEHIRIYTQQTITVYTDIPSTALGVLGPGKVISGLQGWFYPINIGR